MLLRFREKRRHATIENTLTAIRDAHFDSPRAELLASAFSDRVGRVGG